MFDTELSVTPLMGHLGCLESRWSVPVLTDIPYHTLETIHTYLFILLVTMYTYII